MKLRDDSTEKNLLLEEKNRMLAEKQDYWNLCGHSERDETGFAREIHDNVGHLLSRSILLYRRRQGGQCLRMLLWTRCWNNLDHVCE